MRKNPLPALLFARDDRWTGNRLTSLVRKGAIRRIVQGVYTSRVELPVEEVVRTHVWELIAGVYPGSLLSHRSALEFRISPRGALYLTSTQRRTVRWPGVILKFTDGPAPLTDDHPLREGLYASSLERAALENLRPARRSGGERRTVKQPVVEQRLVQLLQSRGEADLNAFRDRAAEIADAFDWPDAYGRVDRLVSALLTTHDAQVLDSAPAIALARGRPYDAARVDLLTKLAGALRQYRAPERPAKTASPRAFANFAFYESYFSNYIEGTTFRVDEARRIVREGEIIPLRREDSHDVRGTYAICGDRHEMTRTITSFSEFDELLRHRHLTIMAARPHTLPGAFKINANRAGNTFFVIPGEVVGTLEQGYELLRHLPGAYARALFLMFLVSEVHPFEDGNGRVARLMMNGELASGGLSKIIIPTVYREDYLLNLRRLTRQQDTAAYLRMMDRAHAFSHWLEPDNEERLQRQLEQSNAFDEEGQILRF